MNKIAKEKKQVFNFDSLYSKLHQSFGLIKDHRGSNSSYKLVDILSSAFAMFSLKSPSLLDFTLRSQVENKNLGKVFNLNKVCSDTQMRQVLDKVSASQIRSLFSGVFKQLKGSALFASYRYFQQMVIVSIDGVEHFCSQKVHCQHCLQKEHKSGEITYSHAMLVAVIVHPDKREVLPIDAEPILQQDGCEKNDCERNAAKRLITHLKASYPKLKALIVEDALYGNGPHIEGLLQAGYHYLIGVKPDSHKTLFRQGQARMQSRAAKSWLYSDKKGKHVFEWVNNLPLCSSQSHIRVNFLRYEQRDEKDNLLQTFTWITDIEISKNNVLLLTRAARSRWKIENETFNTLKNQGYHFEHNYGHGLDQLASVLAYLMLLAFSIDQIQQGACSTFQTVLAGLKTKSKMWESLRMVFKIIPCLSMQQLWENVAFIYQIKLE